MEAHQSAVAVIADKVRDFHSKQQPFRIYHGSTNSTRSSQYTHTNIIDTSNLNNVLHIDPSSRLVLVEPNVPMDKLVSATLALGLVPPVVMEFPGITAGGGFSGTSGESSSFQYGFFDRTVVRIEIVLATGEVVMASSSERGDLFRGAAAAFGTLGVITMLEIQLIEAKPYVELTYWKVGGMAEAIAKMEEETRLETNDYIDGIVLAKNNIVICTGRLISTSPSSTLPIQTFSRPKDPWFYIHAKSMTSHITPSSSPPKELIPIQDYLFRYDRGAFWVGRYAYTYFLTPFTSLTRRLLDTLMHTRTLYHALHQSGFASRYLIQDVAVPYSSAPEFLDWVDSNWGYYPLWLCPLRMRGVEEGSARGLMAVDAATGNVEGGKGRREGGKEEEYLMNFGIWGPGSTNRKKFIDLNRRLEKKVQELGGSKWLYAHAYYTEDEFWSIYDKGAYDALRKKYGADHLLSIYDKVKVDVTGDGRGRGRERLPFWGIWPLAGLYGVWKCWWGGEYLLPKERRWLGGGKRKSD